MQRAGLAQAAKSLAGDAVSWHPENLCPDHWGCLGGVHHYNLQAMAPSVGAFPDPLHEEVTISDKAM